MRSTGASADHLSAEPGRPVTPSPLPPADGPRPAAGGPVAAVSLVVTTGYLPAPQQWERARRLAEELGAPAVAREKLGLKEVARHAGWTPGQPMPWILVVERTRLSLYAAGQRLFYHPGMAIGRLRRIAQGRGDPMLAAMGLLPGETVVDATLGLGADALVAAAAVGPGGLVIGLEIVPALAVLVREGLADYPWPDAESALAAARIQVHAADHRTWLGQAPDGSVDVVYFDVMFERPLSGSAAMATWRTAAFEGAVEPATILRARHVARRAVVLKDRRDSARLQRLAPPKIVGGRSSRVVYGVWAAGGP